MGCGVGHVERDTLSSYYHYQNPPYSIENHPKNPRLMEIKIEDPFIKR
jgi:hypothetical protein